MRSACFPSDEPADAASLRQAANAEALDSRTGEKSLWAAPATAARQTADALGWAAIEVPELAEVDSGRWRGLPYTQVAQTEPAALAAWLSDPEAAPHGGESQADLAARVAGWLDKAELVSIVICDVGVIRAALGHALGLGPLQTARFDVAPLTTTELLPARGGWRVAHVNRKVIT